MPSRLRFGQRLDAGGAAIDGDEQRRALGRRARARLRCWGRSLRRCGRECGSADRARNGADARRAAPPRSRRRRRSRRRSRPSRRCTAASAMRFAAASICRHGEGIGHQLADGRIEEVRHRVDVDAAARQHPRQQLRQLVALHDGKRPRRAARIEPVAPELVRSAERATPRKACGSLDGQGGGGGVMMADCGELAGQIRTRPVAG